jgi:hypothetical protein
VVGILTGLAGFASGFVAAAGDRFGFFLGQLDRSVSGWWDVERLGNTFLRSGYVDRLPRDHDAAINLSALESMPLFGAFIALPAMVVRSLRDGRDRSAMLAVDPARATDALVVVYLALFVTLYLQRLPLQHMLTVRYVHPIYPLGIYGLVRLCPIRQVIETEWSGLVRTYLVGVALGVPTYIGALALAATGRSESVQLYGLVAFVSGVTVALWALVTAGWQSDRTNSVGAVVLGIAAASMTVYLLVSGLGFFAFTNDFLLPISRAIAEALQFVNPYRSLF